MSRESFRDGLVVAALGLGALLFWQLRIIAPATTESGAGGDLYTQIYPMAHRAFALLREGSLPLWNPFQYCGAPFLATVLYGVFYPLNIFFLLLPRTELAIEYTVVLHLWAAGLFMYLYGRVIRLSRAAAAMAAMTFMFSGFLASQALWFTPATSTAAWLPLAFVALERIFETRRRRWSILLAATVAMPLLAGWLQTWLYSMYAIGAYAAFRLVLAAMRRDERPHLPRLCGLVVGGVLLGVCLTSIQLLPTMELQRLGPRRPGGLSLAQTLIYGPPSPAKFLAETVSTDTGHPRFSYLGILALILAPLALFARSDRWRVGFLWCLLLLSVGVALTVYTPLFAVYRALPGGGWFRIPYRILYIYAFAGSVLSGIGFDVIASPAVMPSRRRVWGTIGVAAAIAAAWLCTIEMTARAHIYGVLGVIGVAGALLLPRAWRGVLVAGLMILVVFDLFSANENSAKHPYHDLAPLDAEHEAFDFIRAHQGYDRTYINSGNIFFDYAAQGKQGTLRGIYSVTDYEPLRLDRYGKFYPLLEGSNTIDYTVQTFMGRLSLDPTPARLRLLGMMSVRFIAAGKPPLPLRMGLEKAGWTKVFTPRAGNLAVYENPAPLARAYVATEAWPVAAAEDAFIALTAPGFDPGKVVILESNQSPPPPPGAGNNQAVVPARIVSYAPTRVVVAADTTNPGYLVLTDTFYPGWYATVDGNPAAMYRANNLFRAVAIPAGAHTVIFAYAPLSFELGSGITLITLSGIVVGGAITRRRRPRGGMS